MESRVSARGRWALTTGERVEEVASVEFMLIL
jgi:hypothetical protein